MEELHDHNSDDGGHDEMESENRGEWLGAQQAPKGFVALSCED